MLSQQPQDKIIQNVSDTAWLVATLRSQESKRKDALFNDPFAEILVGEKGRKMVENISSGYDISWFMAVRTYLIDKFILDVIRDNKIDCVVNLAAGLCARAYRLSLPKNLIWYDVDLDPVINYKNTTLAKHPTQCDYRTYSCDLRIDSERSIFWEKVKKESKKILVLTEGLLLYLTEENVSSMANELASHKEVLYWVTDMYLAGTGDLSKWHKFMEDSNAAFRWGPKNSDTYFERFGWKLIDKRGMIEEGQRLNRIPPKVDPSVFSNSPLFDKDMDKLWEFAEIRFMEKV